MICERSSPRKELPTLHLGGYRFEADFLADFHDDGCASWGKKGGGIDGSFEGFERVSR